jgi:hypothetical protein
LNWHVLNENSFVLSNRENNGSKNVSDSGVKVEFDLTPTDDDSNNNNSSTLNFNGLNYSTDKLLLQQQQLPPRKPVLAIVTSPFQPVASVGVASLLAKSSTAHSAGQNNGFLALTTTTTTTTTQQKIARDSLIHKNDVFQFDDVESVHTHDSLFHKHTPHSSFESDDTYKSSLNMDEDVRPNNHNHVQQRGPNIRLGKKQLPTNGPASGGGGNNNKLTQSDNRLMTHLITPILRTVNGSGSNGLHLNAKNNAGTGSFKATRKSFRPESISSNKSSTSPVNNNNNNNNMKKSVTSSIIESSKKNITESVSSLDRRNTFSRHLSSLRRLINSKSGTAVNGGHHTPVTTTNTSSNLSTPNKRAIKNGSGRVNNGDDYDVDDDDIRGESLFIPIDEMHKSNSVDVIPIAINSLSIGGGGVDVKPTEKENVKKTPRKLFKFTLNKKKATTNKSTS